MRDRRGKRYDEASITQNKKELEKYSSEGSQITLLEASKERKNVQQVNKGYQEPKTCRSIIMNIAVLRVYARKLSLGCKGDGGNRRGNAFLDGVVANVI